jgi:hypothetical protein
MNTNPKRLLILFVYYLLASVLEQSAASQPASRELKGTIQLERPEIIDATALKIDGGTTIVTNGYPLTIVVGDLIIDGTATIRSFSEEVLSKLPQKPEPAQAGTIGASFNPGPDSEGQGNAQNGNSGGPGGNGMAGKPGLPGKDAGPIAIVVTGNASGELKILNQGALGGDGGNGGDGGVGGSGQQGGRAVPNMHLGIAMGCEKGPGHGGNGGPGGAGGDGGNGGDVKIGVYGNVSGFRITKCSLEGSHPGAGGLAGKEGVGGYPGFGGRGAPGCEGRIQERKGSPGQTGNSGRAGQPGQVGKGGQHNLEGQPFFHS